MLYFKSCPRCRTGTVENSRDPFGEYLQCLNCGMMHDIPEGTTAVAELKAMLTEARRAAVADENAGRQVKADAVA